MTNENLAKEELKTLVRKSFATPLNSLRSFEELSEATHLSVQTLRRFFGKIDKDKTIGKSSLSVLCQFAGFSSWEDFLQEFQTEQSLPDKDKQFIENMSVVIKNGGKYNVDYHQNTITVDTLNEYAKVIYESRESIEYFYKLYRDNDWICDYIFAWLPNYNYFGQDWFRKILSDRVKKTSVETARLAQCNFLFLGSYLTNYTSAYLPGIESLLKIYEGYRKKNRYMPYHEMRYHTVLLVDAKRRKSNIEFHNILNHYLDHLKQQRLSEFHYQEMIIFLCNTLLWLHEFSLGYELLKEATGFLANLPLGKNHENPIHYYGINRIFVKTTFALTWIANENPDLEEFELNESDFRDTSSFLYKDYIRVMHLAKCILTEKRISGKRKIFTELRSLTETTNYTRIFDILQELDNDFGKYADLGKH
jgi:hypothetical protein